MISISAATRPHRRNWLFVFPAICVGLGSWQVYRLRWKKSLIAEMAEKLTEQPISIDNNNISISQLSSFENRRVNIRGTFLHQHEMLVGPRNKGGPGRPGYYLYTPLLVDQSKTILLVNRGWIPRDYVSPGSRLRLNAALAQPKGVVDVCCMLRNEKYYQPRSLARSLLPQSNTQIVEGILPCWQWVDTESMIHYIKAAASSGDNHYMVTSLFAEEVLDIGEGMSGLDDQLTREMMRWSSEEQGLRKASESMPSVLASLKASQTDPRLFTGKPIIAPPSINVSNKHLEYVYTWFSLAALLLVSLKLGKF